MLTEDGTDGLNSATVLLYQRASSTPNVPGGTITYTFADGSLSGNLGNWTKTVPATDGNPCYCIQATAISTGATDDILSSEWSSPLLIIRDGQDGTSALFPFVGQFSTSGTYYGNPSRTDIVKHNNLYYIARSDAPTAADGTFSGSATGAVPGTANSAYWTRMNNYTNVATDTLFAEGANVANFLFNSGVLRSAAEDAEGQANLVLDGTTGNLYAVNATIKGDVSADAGCIGPLEIGHDSQGYYLRASYDGQVSITAGTFDLDNDIYIDEKKFEVTANSEKTTDSSKYASGSFDVGLKQNGGGFVEINCDQTINTPYSGAPHYDCGLKVVAPGSANAIEIVGDVSVTGLIDGIVAGNRLNCITLSNNTSFQLTLSNTPSGSTILYKGISSGTSSIYLPSVTSSNTGVYYDILTISGGVTLYPAMSTSTKFRTIGDGNSGSNLNQAVLTTSTKYRVLFDGTEWIVIK
jgi:hypothetical protein